MKNNSPLFDYLKDELDNPQLEESFKRQERIKANFEADNVDLQDYSAAFLVVKPDSAENAQYAIQVKSELSQEETIKLLEGFIQAVKNSTTTH